MVQRAADTFLTFPCMDFSWYDQIMLSVTGPEICRLYRPTQKYSFINPQYDLKQLLIVPDFTKILQKFFQVAKSKVKNFMIHLQTWTILLMIKIHW